MPFTSDNMPFTSDNMLFTSDNMPSYFWQCAILLLTMCHFTSDNMPFVEFNEKRFHFY
jgi:hypothetical protein